MKSRTRAVVIAIALAYVTATAVPSGQQPGSPGVLRVKNYSTGDITVPIPDLSTVEIPITVPDAGTLTDVNVSFRINHSFDGDLVISLVHPDNTVVFLVINRGGSGDNFGGASPTVIDDAAAVPISAGAPPFAATYRPEVPLSNLNGKATNGTWKLRIADTQLNDTGTVGVFNLQLSSPCGCTEIAAFGAPIILAEGIGPPNNVADLNETLSVDLSLVNVGDFNTSNLVATLQATGGVVNPSSPQNYGVVAAGGASAGRPFTFTATGTCGNAMTLTLALQDGATDLGTIAYTLLLGSPLPPQTFSNTTQIDVPAFGTGLATGSPALPYPSNIVVAGVPGTIAKLTVGLNLVNHGSPDDIDLLLVSPGGVKMIIMSDVGGSQDAVNDSLTLDDAAGISIPDAGPLFTTAYRPTNFGTGDLFPAPEGPYLSPAPGGTDTLGSAFNGLAPNGTWSLYAVDDAGPDAGNMNGGWQLRITPTGGTCLSASVPSTPTSAMAAARNGKAIVTFSPGVSDGGSAITGYTVVSTPAGGIDADAGTTIFGHVVTGLTNGAAYTFRVRATNVVGNGPLSAPSSSVTPPGFTDFPLQTGVTRIKAVHITELRQRIDLQRARFGQPGFPWTNLTLTPGTTVIQAVHITELRTALAQAYVAGGIMPLPTYTDPGLGIGTTIKRLHITELQNAVMAIE